MESSRTSREGVVGVDLGDRRSQICRIDQESGAILEECRLTTTASFQSYFAGLAPHLVVLESGTHSPWVARLLVQLGHEVIVANPSKVRAISASRRKTDERDARCLARHKAVGLLIHLYASVWSRSGGIAPKNRAEGRPRRRRSLAPIDRYRVPFSRDDEPIDRVSEPMNRENAAKPRSCGPSNRDDAARSRSCET